MLKKYFSNKINLIDGLIIAFPLMWFFMVKIITQVVPLELMINLSFLALFVTMSIFKSSNFRHMHFAFVFLILSVMENIFGFNNLLFLTSGLTVNLLILGTLNMILFKVKD